MKIAFAGALELRDTPATAMRLPDKNRATAGGMSGIVGNLELATSRLN
ncbi:hypothetical protein [uncultured Piscinibacter sp.]|nr:hypothetical protein [uncultured Piscinibacter sp.]